jgi:hypothetical protein
MPLFIHVFGKSRLPINLLLKRQPHEMNTFQEGLAV